VTLSTVDEIGTPISGIWLWFRHGNARRERLVVQDELSGLVLVVTSTYNRLPEIVPNPNEEPNAGYELVGFEGGPRRCGNSRFRVGLPFLFFQLTQTLRWDSCCWSDLLRQWLLAGLG